jgi:hypothetical protein
MRADELGSRMFAVRTVCPVEEMVFKYVRFPAHLRTH